MAILIENIKKIVEEEFGVSDLFRKTRKRDFVEARAACFFIVRSRTNLSLPKMGKVFGINHATIYHGLKIVENLMDVDKEYREKVYKCLNKVEKIG